MKKQIVFIVSMCVAILGWSQNEKPKTFSIPFSGADKKVMIVSGRGSISIEGYTGNEVIIEEDNNSHPLPQEAEGLKIVSEGAVDNTGLGASATIEGNYLKIETPRSIYFGNFKIKIPKMLAVNIKEGKNTYGTWFISGLEGELEVTSNRAQIIIKDVTGPIVARAGGGGISVIFDKLNPNKPSSISANKDVMVSLPADTKASLKLRATFGDVFTDFDITASKPKKSDENEDTKAVGDKTGTSYSFSSSPATVTELSSSRASSNKSWSSSPSSTKNLAAIASSDNNDDSWGSDSYNGMNGTINGGGVKITIHSDSGNIFLRKKK